jgi:hypothetical protein
MKKLLGAAAIVAVVLTVGLGSAVAAGAVTSSGIKNFTIRAVDMATGSVDDRVLDDGSVGKSELKEGLESQLLFGTVPSGRTMRGAVGGDVDAAQAAGDWGVITSLPMKASEGLSDDDVFVNVAGWTDAGGQTQPTTTDTNAGCTGSPANPTAPAGKVCIYVAGGDNAADSTATRCCRAPARARTGSSSPGRTRRPVTATSTRSGPTRLPRDR